MQKNKERCVEWKVIRAFLGRLAFMIFLIFLIFGVVFGVTTMKNDDMFPRLSAGDVLLFYRLEKNFGSQDIIVYEKNGVQYVGRIVAKSGDSVEVTEQATLVINGSTVIENNIYYTTPRYESEIEYPLTLKKNQFFVLCDFREGGKDSRYFGPVDKKDIKGNLITIIRRSNL